MERVTKIETKENAAPRGPNSYEQQKRYEQPRGPRVAVSTAGTYGDFEYFESSGRVFRNRERWHGLAFLAYESFERAG